MSRRRSPIILDPSARSSGLTRRELLHQAAAATALVAFAGCDGESGVSSADGAPLPDCDGAAADAGPLDATVACEETEDNLEGPFYREGAPERSVLVEPDMAGTRLTISGRVLGTDCTPLAAALLDVWQADWRDDETGDYDREGWRLRGRLFTDESGNYELQTIIPGRYLNGATFRPAHIHVKASAEGYELVTTQLYVAGDPFNEEDPFIEPPLIMCLMDDGGGAKIARFDFVLRRAV